MLSRRPAALQEHLQHIVWIDAKKYHLQMGPRGKVLVDMATTEETELTRVDPRAPYSSHISPICIVWYTAVNAAVGPVFFGTVTGTTGQDGGWKVRLTSSLILAAPSRCCVPTGTALHIGTKACASLHCRGNCWQQLHL